MKRPDERRCEAFAERLREFVTVMRVTLSDDPQTIDHEIELTHGLHVTVPVDGTRPLLVGQNQDGTYTFYSETRSKPELIAQIRLVLKDREQRMPKKLETL